MGRRPIDLARHRNGKSASEQTPKLLASPFVLGALASRACYVTPRSCEPWCSEIVALPPVPEPWLGL
eukprot:8300460-Pyramimonas_sp.AAC.1